MFENFSLDKWNRIQYPRGGRGVYYFNSIRLHGLYTVGKNKQNFLRFSSTLGSHLLPNATLLESGILGLRSPQAVPMTQSPNTPGEDNFLGGRWKRNVCRIRLEQAATKPFPKAVARVNLLPDVLRGHSDSSLALPSLQMRFR